MDLSGRRARMVEEQIAARGVRDPRVLAAMRTVRRERFVAAEQAEFAYEDSPLGIAEGQTISQPYIVALMAESLGLTGDESVLEIGTGSGYGAAVLGQVARVVRTVERHGELARVASERLAAAGFDNVQVVHGDGTVGLAEHAPFDAIVVTAGGPRVPEALLDQLAVGGRLVMPIGEDRAMQMLVRVRRLSEREYEQEELQPVRFVPLIGAQGWRPRGGEEAELPRPPAGAPAGLPLLLRECGEPLSSIEDARLDALLERIGDARVVLLGEATHGTSEFYALRAAITRRLIDRKGFRVVAVEADWPDAAVVNRYVQALANGHPQPGDAFRRFPLWMWRNHETRAFVEWLRGRNAERPPEDRTGFFGLDLYSLFTSIRAVLDYLDRVDPDAARAARVRYGCLSPWEGDPQTYARAAVTGRYRVCEQEALGILKDMAARRLEYAERDGVRFLDALQNARLVANAERYYRAMYYGPAASWNLRDRHMFETLERLLGERGADTRAVVWAHNSHLGNASATEMAARGEINLGQLCRQAFGDACYSVGFGTDHGEVAAAPEWDAPMEVMRVRPAHALSYERLFHESGVPAYLLPLRHARRPELRDELASPRLERAIGVVYRPQTEIQSHYFQAVLPSQFDEYVWLDETSAVTPLSSAEARVLPLAHPLVWR
jgi:protein-L-isoaspartate(D-aspartate) O-methyltransferase